MNEASKPDPMALAVSLVSARRGGEEMHEVTFDLLGLNGSDVSVIVSRSVAAAVGLAEVSNILISMLAEAKDLSPDDVLRSLAVSIAAVAQEG